MTIEYDIEHVVSGCEKLSAAIADAMKHPMSDWMHHRLSLLRHEVEILASDIGSHAEDLACNS